MLALDQIVQESTAEGTLWEPLDGYAFVVTPARILVLFRWVLPECARFGSTDTASFAFLGVMSLALNAIPPPPNHRQRLLS
jgi:hypothetical protein